MKCAMELCTVAAIRAAEKAEAEELRRQQQAREKYEHTIRACEKLGQMLEEAANKGKKPYCIFRTDWYGEQLVRAPHSNYADGRVEFIPTGGELDFDVMEAWFAQYCFKVKVMEKTFTYWNYGCGKLCGHTVLIQPDPDCVK